MNDTGAPIPPVNPILAMMPMIILILAIIGIIVWLFRRSARKAREQTQPATNIANELERLSKLNKDGILNDDEFAQAKSQLLTQPKTPPPNADYEMLPNGRKRLLKATGLDIIISFFLPGWGLLVGAIALFVKREKKRGMTMMAIGICSLVFYILTGQFSSNR